MLPPEPVEPAAIPDPGRLIVGVGAHELEPRPVDTRRSAQPAYRSDAVLDGFGNAHWTVRAASVRGDDHREGGIPRQDDFALGQHPRSGTLVLAVADGVSAAAESHHAALHVTRRAVDLLLGQVGSRSGLDLDKVVEHCAYVPMALTMQLWGLREPDAELAVRQLSCTLTLVVVRPEEGHLLATSVTVGDGAVGILSGEGISMLQGGKRGTGGISSSAVLALPRRPELIEITTAAVSPGEVLLVGTDGIWDPLGSGHNQVGDMFRETLLPGPPSLMQFGRVTDFSRETWDDDRTLIAIWPSVPGAERRDRAAREMPRFLEPPPPAGDGGSAS
jgi:serine/threonine protein phosphatase PrpC